MLFRSSGRIAQIPDAGFRIIFVDGALGSMVIFVLAQGGEHQFPVQGGVGCPVEPEDAEVDGGKDGTDDDGSDKNCQSASYKLRLKNPTAIFYPTVNSNEKIFFFSKNS